LIQHLPVAAMPEAALSFHGKTIAPAIETTVKWLED
jgi:hypothetical protein